MQKSDSTFKSALPTLGVGLGLRKELASNTFAHLAEIDWLEFTPENYMNTGSTQVDLLEIAASRFPLVSHSVSLSIGSPDELNIDFLMQLKSFFMSFPVPWFSDHVCYSGAGGLFLHDLLPVPRSKRLVKYIAERVRRAQNLVGLPMLLENISFYLEMPGSEMTESQFLSELLEKADCGLLLDLNNIVVNSKNQKFDPVEFINQIPVERVVQIHMAGHTASAQGVIDTHGEKIDDQTFELLRLVLAKTNVNAIMLERDQNFPPFAELLDELRLIRSIYHEYQPQPNQTNELAHVREPIPILLSSDTSQIGTADDHDDIQMPAAVEGQMPILLSESAQENEAAAIDQQNEGQAEVVDFEALETALARHWLLHKALPKRLLKKIDRASSDLYRTLISNAHNQALRAMYPVCAVLLQHHWSKLALDFVKEHPPADYNYSSFGEPFAEYVKGREDIVDEMPYIVDVAIFERAKLEVIEAMVDVVAEPFSGLKTEEELRELAPVLNQVMALKSFEYPVVEICTNVKDKGRVGDVVARPASLAIFRDPLSKKCQVSVLTERAARLILSITQEDHSYADLIHQFVSRDGQTDLVKGTVDLLDLFTTLHKLRIFVGSRQARMSAPL